MGVVMRIEGGENRLGIYGRKKGGKWKEGKGRAQRIPREERVSGGRLTERVNARARN